MAHPRLGRVSRNTRGRVYRTRTLLVSTTVVETSSVRVRRLERYESHEEGGREGSNAVRVVVLGESGEGGNVHQMLMCVHVNP